MMTYVTFVAGLKIVLLLTNVLHILFIKCKSNIIFIGVTTGLPEI